MVSFEEVAAQEFRQGGVWPANSEKFGKGGPQSVRDDEFGRRPIGVHRGEPTTEELPDGGGAADREVLQQALNDAAELNVGMVGSQFAAHLLAVAVGFAVHVLVAGDAANRRHGHDPEVVGGG